MPGRDQPRPLAGDRPKRDVNGADRLCARIEVSPIGPTAVGIPRFGVVASGHEAL
jgi:hypothetical protein